MTVCSRPFYLQPTLNAWSEVDGIHDWEFLFMVEPTQVRAQQLDLIRHWVDTTGHTNTGVVQNSTRLGVLTNPHTGIDLAFNRGADFVMLAEEDLQPHPDVLSYMSYCADTYRDPESRVLTVCTNPPELRSPPNEITTIPMFASWLWGTWSHRWPLLSSTWDHDYSSGSGSTSGWDWNISLRVIPNNTLTSVFPGSALCKNLGQYLGVHAVPADFENAQTLGFDPTTRIKSWVAAQ